MTADQSAGPHRSSTDESSNGSDANTNKDRNSFVKRPIQGLKNFVNRRRPSIDEVVRETTSGGIVYRHNAQSGKLEILLIQDAKNRWTIPKGHVEEGEEPKQTAKREINEETGCRK